MRQRRAVLTPIDPIPQESLASKPGAETITAALRHAEKAAEAMGLISSKADIDDVNASLVQVRLPAAPSWVAAAYRVRQMPRPPGSQFR